jgi:hypothetical protein
VGKWYEQVIQYNLQVNDTPEWMQASCAQTKELGGNVVVLNVVDICLV